MNPTPEEAPLQTPEMLAVQGLDAVAERIIAEYPGPFDPSRSSLSTVNGGSLEVTTDQDGKTFYKHVALWHATGDKGCIIHRWQKSGDEVTYVRSSELHGNSEPQLVDAKSMDNLKDEIEHSFPPKLPESTTKGVVRRLLGRFSTRNAL